MTRRRMPDFPEPDKPAAEMTPAEQSAYARAILRSIRDDQVRRGSKRPQTMREVELAHQGFVEREARRDRRAARRARKQAAAERASPDPAGRSAEDT